jgi:hypothetical protein
MDTTEIEITSNKPFSVSLTLIFSPFAAGTCGTCAVEINSGTVEPAKRNTKERFRLSFPPHGDDSQSPNLRLACQVQVRGNLDVTKRSGFWGQRQPLSPSKECKTFFGDLEYLLDNRSPQEEEQK